MVDYWRANGRLGTLRQTIEAKSCSIGLRSGLQGGRNSSLVRRFGYL
ncbi:MAG TPA: hypothetical protein VF485_06635 [Sphingomonas sp.]